MSETTHGWRATFSWKVWAFGVGFDFEFGDYVLCLGPLTVGWSR
jgi:hypothetical protein